MNQKNTSIENQGKRLKEFNQMQMKKGKVKSLFLRINLLLVYLQENSKKKS